MFEFIFIANRQGSKYKKASLFNKIAYSYEGMNLNESYEMIERLTIFNQVFITYDILLS